MTPVRLIENIEDAVLAVDTGEAVVSINAAMQALLQTDEAAPGKSLRNVASKHYGLFEPFLSLPHARAEVTLDEPVRHFELQMLPLEQAGELTGRLFILHEITDRKLKELQLRFHASLQESTSDGVYSTDMNFIIQSWNKAAERIYGWRADEVTGRYAPEIVQTQISEEMRTQARKDMVEQGYWKGEIVQKHKDGTHLNILVSSVVFYDEAGQPVGLVSVNHDITERKKAEEALAEERNLLRILIDAVPEYIYVKDLQHRLILNNVAHAQGRARTTPDTLIGKTDFDLFPPHLARVFMAAEKMVFDTGMPLIDHEEEGLDPDGKTIWSLSTKVPLRRLNGQLIGLVGITRDITLRKQREATMRRIEDEHSRLYEQTQTALAETQAYARRLDALNAMSREVNIAATEGSILEIAAEYIRRIFEGEQFIIFMLDDASMYLTVVVCEGAHQVVQVGEKVAVAGTITGKVIQTAQPVNVGDLGKADSPYAEKLEEAQIRSYLVVPIMSGQGAIGAVSLTALRYNAYQTQDQQLLEHMGSFLGIAIENVRQSRELRHAVLTSERASYQAQMLLAETQSYAKRLDLLNEMSQKINQATTTDEIFVEAAGHIRPILNTHQFTIFLAEPENDQVTVAVNEGIDEAPHAGMTIPIKGTLVGNVIRTGETWTQDDLAEYRGNVHPSVAEIIRKSLVRSVMIVPMRVGQRVVGAVLIGNSSPLVYSDEDKVLLLHIATFLGIAIENLRRNEQVQQALLEAEKANRAKGDFLANVSHELRTPLNGILGYVQILRKDRELTTKQRSGLEIIYRSGDVLLSLINDILDFSKIEAQHMELSTSAFHLTDMIKAMCDLIRVRAEQKNLMFSYEQLSELPAGVYGDEGRLRQVLLNLLSNAVKYTEQGGVTLKVGYSEERIRFQIEDTGIGIAPEAMQMIFKPFTQAARRGAQIEGTGLGLSISNQLIALMGSTLEVKSDAGTGSTFWFELDLPAVEGFERAAQSEEIDIAGYQGDPQRVMVVDDKYENRAVLTGILQPLGFVLMEAINGQDCLDRLPDFRPHMVLMDLRMPVMSGLETIHHIRQMPAGQDVAIIAISASAFEYNREESRRAGADDFMPKPFRLQHLLDVIGKYLHLTWIVEEHLPIEVETLSGEVIAPPDSELDLLLDMSMQGDIRGMVNHCDQLARNGYEAFAARLRALAQDFKTRELRQFIKQYKGS